MSEENDVVVVETESTVLAPEVPERTLIDRTMSLNIQSDTGRLNEGSDNDDSPPDLSGVKISLHLSMDQGGNVNVVSGSKTKKFLESDDAIISQIFSQTICSTGVTPTDENDEFFAGTDDSVINTDSLEPTQYTTIKSKKPSSIESPRSVNSNEDDDDEEEIDDDDDGLVKGASRLTILNNQQRPSIVIDCFDETPPISPPEEMTPSAGAAFYFHTTIVDEDDVEDTGVDSPGNDGENSSFDQSSSAQLNDDMHLDDELLQQAVAIVDNFTTIVEDDDDIVDQIIATDDIDIESKTDNNSINNLENDTITISNEETTINQTYKELAETETNEAPTHFLANSNGMGFEPPEPAMLQTNQVDPITYTNGSGLGHESEEDEEDDDSCSNNLTAKTFSFDDEALKCNFWCRFY
uniref:CSON006681 protein n=1 Tax=Culicoides sonorensis TaxID=179676 RepID=A0A336MU11_CULSO